MIHDCKYAQEIGAEPVWLGSIGSQVCSLCHTPKTTKTVEVPVEVEDNLVGEFAKAITPEAKRVTRTSAGK